MAPFYNKINLNDDKLTDTLLWILVGFSLIMIFYVQYPSLVDKNRVQDDARQHIYWMAKFYDSELFEDDFITEWQIRELEFLGFRFFYDYKNIGFSIIYYIASFIVNPIFFNLLFVGES